MAEWYSVVGMCHSLSIPQLWNFGVACFKFGGITREIHIDFCVNISSHFTRSNT